MPTRRIPKYRHQKSRNLAVVRLHGKDVYLGEFDSPESHARYEQLIAQWLRCQQPSLDGIVNLRLAELMAAYLTFARSYYVKHGKSTREFGCISEALREVRKVHETTLVADFGPKALKRVRERMVGLGRSRKYVNKQIGRLVRMFKWGVSEELVPPTVHQALRLSRTFCDEPAAGFDAGETATANTHRLEYCSTDSLQHPSPKRGITGSLRKL